MLLVFFLFYFPNYVPSVGEPGHTYILPGIRIKIKINSRYRYTCPGQQVLDRSLTRNTYAFVQLRRTRSSNLSTSTGRQVLDRSSNRNTYAFIQLRASAIFYLPQAVTKSLIRLSHRWGNQDIHIFYLVSKTK
jgi:hypothetical protein